MTTKIQFEVSGIPVEREALLEYLVKFDGRSDDNKGIKPTLKSHLSNFISDIHECESIASAHQEVEKAVDDVVFRVSHESTFKQFTARVDAVVSEARHLVVWGLYNYIWAKSYLKLRFSMSDSDIKNLHGKSIMIGTSDLKPNILIVRSDSCNNALIYRESMEFVGKLRLDHTLNLIKCMMTDDEVEAIDITIDGIWLSVARNPNYGGYLISCSEGHYWCGYIKSSDELEKFLQGDDSYRDLKESEE